MKNSLWTQDSSLPSFPKLFRDKKTDVLIIGGGMCGILCAHFLKQAGVRAIVAEADTIACGTTKNTTAKITFQHSLIYDKIIRTQGREKAQMYLEANRSALNKFEELSKGIDCGFKKLPAFTYSMRDTSKIENEVNAVNSLGFNASFQQTPELPFETKGAICFPEQAQFNPLQFISEIAKGLEIYENTFIRDITPDAAISDGGKIKAKAIIVATHFPFINKHGSYFLKLYQHRSYVCAFENIPEFKGMYVDEDLKGLSLRSSGSFTLIGGASHRTGEHSRAWEQLHDFKGQFYPNATLKYEWAAQDCMSLDSIAYIGQYSKNTPSLYVATGFNKWGMTSSMAAAQILCDMILGRKNDFSQVFSPQRSILKPQLFINSAKTVLNFLTPTARRCPHLGCALKYNEAEHSWDCPCHGSRFRESGRLIDNPATGDANI